MGLEQQLEEFKEQFLRTAPAGRAALYGRRLRSSEQTSLSKRPLEWEPRPPSFGCRM
jgi:hypothetical protein